jgi:predicted O-methyltransferase YrrM
MFKQLKNKLHEWNAGRELKKYAPLLAKEAEGLNAEQLIELIYSPKWERFFWIKQVPEEILNLTKLIEQQKPKHILEIGTANGGSLFLFSKLADKNATIISVDLPGGRYGGGYPKYREKFYLTFVNKNQKMILYRADSHSPTTLSNVKNILNGEKIDFLFIDGDHTYQGVKADFELYSPLVKSGGLIGFHDIAEHPQNWNVGVKEFFNEIKSNYEYKEFIADPKQGWAGIGVIKQK